MGFQEAQENIAVDVRQRKQYHDQNVRCHLLREGDIVLVKVYLLPRDALEGRGKIKFYTSFLDISI